jgi:hypothetical protein
MVRPAPGESLTMTTRAPKYSMEEHARMATDLFEKIRPIVEPGNHGRILAVDVDSGDYELGDDTLSTGDRLLARHPDAQTWMFRIGFPYVYRI